MTPGAFAQRLARVRREPTLAHLSAVRVTGCLVEPAHIHTRPVIGASGQVQAWLHLLLQPAQGLPYRAELYLGTTPAERAAADAALPLLRTGALVSVAGDSLSYCADHGRAVLRVHRARDLVIPEGEPTPNPRPEEG